MARDPRPAPDDAEPEDLGETHLASVPDLSTSMELVERVQAGDRAALNELLERYKPRLLRIVRVRMGSRLRRHIEEEDVVQEVFLIAARKVNELVLETQGGILQWLAKIALNEIRNKAEFYSAQKRDRDREVRLRADSGSTGGARVAATGPSPSQNAARAELLELIDSSVEELDPPEYREVILQRDYYSESWERVRERLGSPSVHAAQELYRRAHAKLRERMIKHMRD